MGRGGGGDDRCPNPEPEVRRRGMCTRVCIFMPPQALKTLALCHTVRKKSAEKSVKIFITVLFGTALI